MSNKITVQVIRTPGRDEFFAECMGSLGDEPVDVIVEPLVGTQLEARLNFIDEAVTEYVSFVDDDDMVVPGIYEKLLSVVNDDVVGAHAQEAYISAGGQRLNLPVEYNRCFTRRVALKQFFFPRPFILRTDVAKEVSKFIRAQPGAVKNYLYPEFTIAALATAVAPWVEVSEVGYLYRKHTGNHGHTKPHTWLKSQTRQLISGVYASLEPEGYSDTKDQAE